MKRSYIAEPSSPLALMILERDSNLLTTELPIQYMRWTGMSLDVRETGETKPIDIDRN
jgi:hypothetical protein